MVRVITVLMKVGIEELIEVLQEHVISFVGVGHREVKCEFPNLRDLSFGLGPRKLTENYLIGIPPWRAQSILDLMVKPCFLYLKMESKSWTRELKKRKL